MLVRSDNLYEEIYNFKVVHGNAAIQYLVENNFNYIPTISKDVHVVMVTNMPDSTPINKQYAKYPDKLNFTCIVLNTHKFRCGLDITEPIFEFIKTINTKYVLYIDASDTAIVSDILDPQMILDTYKCKILFNAEDGYSFPDHPLCADKPYMDAYAKYHNSEPYSYYQQSKEKAVQINIQQLFKKLNCAPYVKSLNSGVFLAEREYLVEIMTKMLELTYDDPIKGYPYGEVENQKMWQYLQSICENGEIEIDFLNLFFLWCHDRKFTFPTDSWEHFNYFNKLNTL
jgi:hypothetical protein